MMKSKKWVIGILLMVVMVFNLIGCSNKEEPNSQKESTTETEGEEQTKTDDAEPMKIAVLLPGPTGYFIATREGIDNAVKENNVEIEYADAQWDAGKQLSQAEDFMVKGVDLIALCSVDSSAGEKIVRSANEANVPVLAFTNAIGTNETGEYDGLVSYVGQNEVNTGAVTGEIAKKLLGEVGGKAILIEGVPGTTPQINRKKGLEQVLEGSNIEIVYNQTSNWEKEQALKIVEDIIQKNTEFNIVICQDDNSATGAGQALKEAGLRDKVKVIGLGGSKDGLQAIKDGLIDGTTYMSAVEEGKIAIETSVKFLKGETVGPVTEIKQVEVTNENVDTFKGEW